MERLTERIDDRDNPDCKLSVIKFGVRVDRVVDKLAAYEEIGYEPDELSDLIENLKRLLQSCHEPKDLLFIKWVKFHGEVIPVTKVEELLEAECDGRIIILPKNPEPINPCTTCDTGWESISSNGKSESCYDTCPRREAYIKELSEYRERNKS